MSTTTAKCGHQVPTVGAPGSTARRMAERRPCCRARCRSGLPAKFTEEECEAYNSLLDCGVTGWMVDYKDKSVTDYNGRKYGSLIVFSENLPPEEFINE